MAVALNAIGVPLVTSPDGLRVAVTVGGLLVDATTLIVPTM